MFKAKISVPSVNVSGSCPIPLNPGEFWVTALKAIYGPSHVLIGLSPNPTFTKPNGELLTTGPLLSGLVFTFGAGMAENEGIPTVQVKLLVQDLKMINADTSMFLEYDHSRPGTDCTLLTLDPKKIFDKFTEFANPMNWPSLASELATNPIEFYSRNIAMFYPAGIDFSFNVKGTTGGPLAIALGQDQFINSSPVVIKCGSTPAFPPTDNMFFQPQSVVQLVKQMNPAIGVANIQKIETLFAHIFNGPEEKWCVAIAEGELTAEWIREQVTKFFKL